MEVVGGRKVLVSDKTICEKTTKTKTTEAESMR